MWLHWSFFSWSQNVICLAFACRCGCLDNVLSMFFSVGYLELLVLVVWISRTNLNIWKQAFVLITASNLKQSPHWRPHYTKNELGSSVLWEWKYVCSIANGVIMRTEIKAVTHEFSIKSEESSVENVAICVIFKIQMSSQGDCIFKKLDRPQHCWLASVLSDVIGTHNISQCDISIGPLVRLFTNIPVMLHRWYHPL